MLRADNGEGLMDPSGGFLNEFLIHLTGTPLGTLKACFVTGVELNIPLKIRNNLVMNRLS